MCTNMGGRSGKLSSDIRIEGSAPKGYEKQANAIIKGTTDVLRSFGLEDELKGIVYSESGKYGKSNNAAAGMNGFGELTITSSYLKDGKTDSKGYFVNDTFYGTGAHEAGHAVVNALLKSPYVRINPGDTDKTDARTNLERASARSQGKLETAIIKEAKRRYGSNPPISGYGSKNRIEKVAEAVSDVFSNKSNANPYSKVIVKVMEDIKKGKFMPTIKVSEREMMLR